MAHFFGSIRGNKGEASRLGTKESGIDAIAASWAGAIRVVLYVDSEGRDCYRVYETPWHGRGRHRTIEEGVIGADS